MSSKREKVLVALMMGNRRERSSDLKLYQQMPSGAYATTRMKCRRIIWFSQAVFMTLHMSAFASTKTTFKSRILANQYPFLYIDSSSFHVIILQTN